MPKAKRAVVFGVFDRLHPGHLALLAQARAKAEEVIAIIARDEAVFRIKGRKPHDPEKLRAINVRKTGLVKKAVLGDRKEGEYRVLQRMAPDLLVFGYDQKALLKDVRQKIRGGELPAAAIFVAKPYLPERFHTQLLTK